MLARDKTDTFLFRARSGVEVLVYSTKDALSEPCKLVVWLKSRLSPYTVNILKILFK